MLLKNARLLTLDDRGTVLDGDLLIEGDRIAAIGPCEVSLPQVEDLGGRLVMPGFVQTHVHLCQTLFRGLADDLELLEWLRHRIWPLEAAHTPASLQASALLGGMELLAGGTTTILSMETVHHTDSVFEAVDRLGLRAFIGKCLMDKGEAIPAGLRQNTRDSLAECERLLTRWDGQGNGRLRLALAPRFALSCSPGLLREVGALSAARGLPIHSHAAENLREVQAVYAATGMKNVAFFRHLGLPPGRLYLAHCVWLDDSEMDILHDDAIHVLHCPSSNLKLGSGLAMIPELRRRGVCVSLGADGAPCNNNLDMFTELRTAALLQRFRYGPRALPAAEMLRLATRGGAAALGLDQEIGSLEPGKKADLIVLDREPLHAAPINDEASALVYAYRAADVYATMVDGRFVYRAGQFPGLDAGTVRQQAREEQAALLGRADLTQPGEPR